MVPEKSYKLTEKQKRFCKYYLIHLNATESARLAGYSEKTARVIGQENLLKPAIKSYLEELGRDLEQTLGISRAMVANEHKKIALSSIAHLHNSWINRTEFEQLTDEQKSCIQEIATDIKKFHTEDGHEVEVEKVRIKLYDKQKSLDALSRMFGYDAPNRTEIGFQSFSDLIMTLKQNESE